VTNLSRGRLLSRAPLLRTFVNLRWDLHETLEALGPFPNIRAFGQHDPREALRALDDSKVSAARFAMNHRYGLDMVHHGFCLRALRGSPRAELVWGTGRFSEGALLPLLEVLAGSGRREIVVSLPKTGRAAALAELSAFRANGVEVREEPVPFDPWKS